MTEEDLTPPRAVAVGMPDRLRTDVLANLPGVVVVDALTEAAAVLDAAPRSTLIYGELVFGAAVSGQPVFALDGQREPDARHRVAVLIDTDPNKLDALEWDDPRRLAVQAALRLNAGVLVDVSEPGTWAAFSELLDRRVAEPPGEGVPSAVDGNDETNGDPDDQYQHAEDH